MNCPRCKEAMQRGTARGGAIEIDRCAKCGGMWFDHGEIGEIIGAPSTARLSIPPNAKVKDQEACPRCAKPLHNFAYPGTVTLVEGCRNCAGIWLEAGEFEEIRKLRDAPQRMVCPKCGHSQPKGDACAQCGIIVAKYTAPSPRVDSEVASAMPRATRPPIHDEIPGVKGSLIRFIDKAMSSMLDGMRK